MSEGSYSVFFYGTLVHPAVLGRIIGRPGNDLTVQRAVLPDYQTASVKGADYPALLDSDRYLALPGIQDTDKGDENPSLAVPGTLVHGITRPDLRLLDKFEGEEYERRFVRVIIDDTSPVLSNASRPKDASLADVLAPLTAQRIQELAASPHAVQEAQTYVWIGETENLSGDPWSFADFARSKSHRWVGPGLTEDAQGGDGIKSGGDHAWEEYAAVDKFRSEPESFSQGIDASGGSSLGQAGAGSTFGAEGLSLSSSSASAPVGPDPWADGPTSSASAAALSAAASQASNPWASDGPTQFIPAASSGGSGDDFGLEKLGHPAQRYFQLADGWVNLNNGSFGACPKPVTAHYKALQDKTEEMPDLFLFNTLPELLKQSKERLSTILHAPEEELVLVANATTGFNAIARDILWEAGDAILYFSTVYGAVERTIQWLQDTHPSHPSTVVVPISYPCSHDDVVAAAEKAIKEVKAAGKQRIRLAVVDAISSMPGVIVPWERLVALFKKENILSFVDAAHAIGQIPVNLATAQPDFFVSNCHKWLYARRGCAILYVPRRNQHLNVSSLPTSHSYVSGPTQEKNQWAMQWGFMGTTEFATLLTVPSALDFREKIGGEARIMEYTHSLAVRGGEAVARILGTEVMDMPSGELTAAMTNVRLPIIAGAGMGAEKFNHSLRGLIMNTIMSEFKTAIPVYWHAGKIWARLSGQIWLELSDFEYGGRALKEICRRLNSGEMTI